MAFCPFGYMVYAFSTASSNVIPVNCCAWSNRPLFVIDKGTDYDAGHTAIDRIYSGLKSSTGV